MRHYYAVPTLLTLAGAAYGFTVNQFQIQPNQAIEPSSGDFVNNDSGEDWIGAANLVTGDRTTWKNYSSFIALTTWLCADRYGGGGVYSYAVPGPGDDPIIPEWNGNTILELGAGPRQLNGGPLLISGIDGGPGGYVWGADDIAPSTVPSAVSPVNGISKDSVFFGQFVFTDPNATLIGADLLVTIDGADHFLAFDGAPDPGGYHIEYEPFITFEARHALRAFVVIPAPGALATLGAAALPLARRRHRHQL